MPSPSSELDKACVAPSRPKVVVVGAESSWASRVVAALKAADNLEVVELSPVPADDAPALPHSFWVAGLRGSAPAQLRSGNPFQLDHLANLRRHTQQVRSMLKPRR